MKLADYARLLRRDVAETRRAIQRRPVPGRLAEQPGFDGEPIVFLRSSEALKIPGLLPPLGAFLACLRCGFDAREHPNPAIAEVIALIPANLKDLPLGQVLKVAEQIGLRLGRDKQQRRDMQRLRRMIKRHVAVLRALRQAMDRLAIGSGLRGWLPKDARGIRRDPTPADTESPRSDPETGGAIFNLGAELGFARLPDGPAFRPNPAVHAALVAAVAGPARQLRRYFERLGQTATDEYAVRRGRRLDLGRVVQALFRRSPDLLVHSYEQAQANAYVGVLIDRSGSMEGDKLARAKAFALLVAESLKDLRGIDGHVSAFDDHWFYRLGSFAQNAVAALTAGNGNNDAGALARAAELARASRRRHKLLIMISDGLPTQCTFVSLKNLVQRLTERYGLTCVQVAVDALQQVAFQNYVDLSAYPLPEAVARFGQLLMKLSTRWYPAPTQRPGALALPARRALGSAGLEDVR